MKKTVCSYCGVGCNFFVEKDKLKGAKKYPVNQGLSCSKGLSLIDTIDKNRLLTCDVKGKEKKYEEIIKIIADKLKKTPSDKIGIYLSGQLLNEDYYVANKFAKGFLKTPNIDTNSRTCVASASVGYKKAFGVDYIPVRMNDIDKTDLMIIIGGNPAEAHVVLFQKILKAKKNGMKLIVIDPRFTNTAKQADLYIPITPGNDIDFLNLISIRLIKENFIDKNFIDKYVNGFEEYKTKLLKLNEDKLLQKSGILKSDFENFMNMLKNSKKFMTAWTMGINQSVQGVDKNLAILNLHLITGQIIKEGCGPFGLTGQPNAMGGREVGGLATTLAVHLDYNEENCKKVANFWKVESVNNKIGYTAFEMIDKVDVLLIFHTDPVYHLPNRKFVEKVFKNIDTVIEVNAYKGSQTSRFADIRISAAPFAEKDGTQTNIDRTLTRAVAFKEKKAKQDWEIIADIAKEMGFSGFDFKSSEEVFNEYKDMTKLSPDMNIYKADYKKLENEPFIWGENALDNGFFTSNKKANLFSVENKELHELTDIDYPFILITGRTRDQWNSGAKTGLVKKLKKYKSNDFIEINQKDAENLNLKNHDYVWIKSRYGKIKGKILISDIKKGNIFIPIHNIDINYLTNPKIDKESKEPDYNHTAVKIIKESDIKSNI